MGEMRGNSWVKREKRGKYIRGWDFSTSSVRKREGTKNDKT